MLILDVQVCGYTTHMAKKTQEEKRHSALYREYRPHTFKDVRGQDQVVSVLEAAIKKGTIAHAYVFSGTRGTGKTSIARILAHELGTADHDIYEIDAASNRGIDDIRELRDGVALMPFSSRYKVYIIDEAHMLTKEAWNALLKTLEEPPAHVLFIFATTELHKVPDTIKSRCDVYTFSQPSRALLSDVVSDVAKQEGYTLERSAADLVATLAEGSFRDALGILQKVLTISKDKKVDIAEVEKVTGAPTGAILRALTTALHQGDSNAALKAVHEAITHNMDARTLLKLTLERVRAVMLARNAPDVAVLIAHEFTQADFAELTAMGKDPSSKINSHLLRALLAAHEQMAYAAVPHLPIELAILDTFAVGNKVAAA